MGSRGHGGAMKIITINIPKAFYNAMFKLAEKGHFPSISEGCRLAIRDFLMKELKLDMALSIVPDAPHESTKTLAYHDVLTQDPSPIPTPAFEPPNLPEWCSYKIVGKNQEGHTVMAMRPKPYLGQKLTVDEDGTVWGKQ